MTIPTNAAIAATSQVVTPFPFGIVSTYSSLSTEPNLSTDRVIPGHLQEQITGLKLTGLASPCYRRPRTTKLRPEIRTRTSKYLKRVDWSGKRESNPRPSAWEGA
jgi:hypothetical protein